MVNEYIDILNHNDDFNTIGYQREEKTLKSFVSYDYYIDVYGGFVIPPEDFTDVSKRASSRLNFLTQKRIRSRENPKGYCVDDAVMSATCALSDLMYKQMATCNQSTGGNVQSETVDSHSVTLTKESDIQAQWASWEKEVLQLYLANTGLLYKGLNYRHNRCCHDMLYVRPWGVYGW